MKHLVISLFLLFLSACSSSLTQNESSLYGTWMQKDFYHNIKYRVELLENRRFNIREDFEMKSGQSAFFMQGYWSFTADSIKFNGVYTDSTGGSVNPNRGFNQTLKYLLSRDTLKIDFFPEQNGSHQTDFYILTKQKY